MTDLLEQGIEAIEIKDLIDCPVWRDDRDKDLYFPVYKPGDMPEDARDVIIRSKFFTPNGLEFDGYIKGIDKGINTLLVIWLFHNGKKYGFNNKLPKLCHDELSKLESDLPADIGRGVDNFFPLRYETRFNWEDEGYQNFWGEFDAFLRER